MFIKKCSACLVKNNKALWGQESSLVAQATAQSTLFSWLWLLKFRSHYSVWIGEHFSSTHNIVLRCSKCACPQSLQCICKLGSSSTNQFSPCAHTWVIQTWYSPISFFCVHPPCLLFLVMKRWGLGRKKHPESNFWQLWEVSVKMQELQLFHCSYYWFLSRGLNWKKPVSNRNRKKRWQ